MEYKSKNGCINTSKGLAARWAQHLLCSLWSPKQRTWHLCIQRTWERPWLVWMQGWLWTKNMSPAFSGHLNRHIRHNALAGKPHIFCFKKLEHPASEITNLWHPALSFWSPARHRSSTTLHLLQPYPQDIIPTRHSHDKNNNSYVWILFDKLAEYYLM